MPWQRETSSMEQSFISGRNHIGQTFPTVQPGKRLYNPMYMLTQRLAGKSLWRVPLLLVTLACAVHWSLSRTPGRTDPAVPASPYAGCPALLPGILEAAASYGGQGHASLSDGALDVSYLVVYDVRDGELGPREDLILPASPDQRIESRAAHEYIWSYFKAIIPARDRSFVSEFSILSDGRDNILAGVSPTYRDPGKWTLKVDSADAGDPYSLTYSLLHEYGHLLTLNASQVPPDQRVFFHPGNRAIHDQAVASCPRYFTGEGCSNAGSYMNGFFDRFWSSVHAEWQRVQNTEGPEARQDRLNAFHHAHEDQFLTRYAATGPEEDIAESWAYFILSPKPEPASVADQKILFFYDYPELISLRQEILNRLCAAFPGS